jgi:hypothetical protein
MDSTILSTSDRTFADVPASSEASMTSGTPFVDDPQEIDLTGVEPPGSPFAVGVHPELLVVAIDETRPCRHAPFHVRGGVTVDRDVSRCRHAESSLGGESRRHTLGRRER